MPSDPFQMIPISPGSYNPGVLIGLLHNNSWPFHSKTHYTIEEAQNTVARESYFHGSGIQTFLINYTDTGCDGILRVFDLGENCDSDETPLFDIKIAGQERKNGLGTKAVQEMSTWVFTHYPNKQRIEGATRFDNHAMIRLFEKCGFVKEAHYRRAWKIVEEGYTTYCDCVGYGLLRSDWESGAKTPTSLTS